MNMRRRRKRKPLTKKQREEFKQAAHLYKRLKKLKLKKMTNFLKEYKVICRKYGCYIWGNLSNVHKEDKIYNVKDHLVSMTEGLKREF